MLLIKIIFIVSCLNLIYQPSSAIDNIELESELKSCLSATYTAEKAYFAEYDKFSENIEDIGIDYSGCPNLEFRIYVKKNTFVVYAYDINSKKIIGSINDIKELIIK